MLPPAVALLLLLLLAAACPMGIRAQTSVTAVVGTGMNASSGVVLQAISEVEARASRPTDIIYRVIETAATVATDVSASTSAFGVSMEGLDATTFASMGGAGATVQVPFALTPLSVYYNIPGAPAKPLNMSICLLSSLATGSLVAWTNVLSINPGLTIVEPSSTPKFFYDSSSASTRQLWRLLNTAAAAGCQVPNIASITGTASTNPAASVLNSPYSFAALLRPEGAAYELKEAALAQGSSYVTPSDNDDAAAQAAYAALLPASYTSDWSSVSALGMSGTGVYPALAASLFVMRTAQGGTNSDQGPLLQALGKFLLSDEVQSWMPDYSMVPIGSTTASAASTALNADIALGANTPYTLEALGTTSAAGNNAQTVSATREDFASSAIAALRSEVAELRSTVSSRAPRILRGSGSSAVSLFMWRTMDSFSAKATSPVWMTYRATGSGTGEAEIAGSSPSAIPATEFGCSDVGMQSSIYTSIVADGAKLVHVPILIAPVAFFINIPTDVMPKPQSLRLSSCTIAQMFMGGVATWDAPEIAADNPGVVLPSQPVVPIFRDSSSGTNAIVSEYLSATCPDWNLGSGKTIPASGAAGTFAANIVGVSSSSGMVNFISSNPWTIGYSDAGNGIELGLLEVTIQNANGFWVTSQTADVSAAASALFQSGNGWPAMPSDDFSGVSLLNQPGDTVFPICAMPFMLVRTDLTTKSESGPLAAAFVQYMLSDAAQDILPGIGFARLPSDVRDYAISKALPLLMTDPRFPPWVVESGSSIKHAGAGAGVLSSFRDTYIHIASQSAGGVAATTVANGTGNVDLSSLNLDSLAGIDAMKESIASLQDQVDGLRAIAAAGLAFGIIALIVALYITIRILVLHSTGSFLKGLGSGKGSAGKVTTDDSVRKGPRKSNSDAGYGSGSGMQWGLLDDNKVKSEAA